MLVGNQMQKEKGPKKPIFLKLIGFIVIHGYRSMFFE